MIFITMMIFHYDNGSSLLMDDFYQLFPVSGSGELRCSISIVMHFHHADELSWQWWLLTIMMNFHHSYEFSSQYWIFITEDFVFWIGDLNTNSSVFITMMTTVEEMYHNNKFFPREYFSSEWWIFITMMNFHHYDEFSSPWWIFITVMNFHHYDEFSSLW